MFKNKFFWWDSKWRKGFEYDTAKECYRAALAERRAIIAEGEAFYEITIWINGRTFCLPGLNSPLTLLLEQKEITPACYLHVGARADTIEELINKLMSKEVTPTDFSHKMWQEVWKIITKYYGWKYTTQIANRLLSR